MYIYDRNRKFVPKIECIIYNNEEKMAISSTEEISLIWSDVEHQIQWYIKLGIYILIRHKMKNKIEQMVFSYVWIKNNLKVKKLWEK